MIQRGDFRPWNCGAAGVGDQAVYAAAAGLCGATMGGRNDQNEKKNGGGTSATDKL